MSLLYDELFLNEESWFLLGPMVVVSPVVRISRTSVVSWTTFLKIPILSRMECANSYTWGPNLLVKYQ